MINGKIMNKLPIKAMHVYRAFNYLECSAAQGTAVITTFVTFGWSHLPGISLIN